MSRADDSGTSQSWDRARHPTLSNTNWEQVQLPAQVRLLSISEDVSPRSKGAIALTDTQKEEILRKPGDAKARASPSLDMHTSTYGPNRPPPDPFGSCAPGTADSKQSTLNSVSPELLTELRKIIREEFETLKSDTKEQQEGVADKPMRASIARERPSSPVQPFINAAGVFVHPYPVKDTEDKTGQASVPSPTKPSSTQLEQKGSPRTSTVRFSDETKPAEPIAPRLEEPRMASTDIGIELTAIDMRWGALFDKDGAQTKRMEHVVRGLANYIVEEFMPQKSIVITPEKMAAFYSHHRLEKEVFPFSVVFRARSKDFNGALESLYEDLGCQYFLVQADERSRHTTPALTPQGFTHWIVSMIQAYPDEEAKRLDKVVSALPIEADSLLDGKPERLPKQISRYLLPKEPVRKIRRLVDDALNDFREDIEGSASQPSKTGNRPTPIIVTATSDKRAPTSVPTSGTSRYVPEKAPSKETDAANSVLDKDRRPSMPPPPVPNKTGRVGFAADSTRSSQSSKDTQRDVPSRAPSSASTRKNRSPQRNPYTQSAPSGIERDDTNGERFRSSASIQAAAAGVIGIAAAAVSTHTLGKESEKKTMKDTRNTDYFSPFRDRRASLEDSATRPAPSSREKVDTESSSMSRSSKQRRSTVLPDFKRPTWDDYLKKSAPKSATPGPVKKTYTS